MGLNRLEDFNPNYREEVFDGEELKGLPVYAGNTDEKIGTVHNVLVDENGHFRYFVIDTGFWIFGKKVLLPVGRAGVDVREKGIHALGITTKEQIERLPEYDENMMVDYDYEEQVRRVYRTPIEPETVLPAASPSEEADLVAKTPIPSAYDPNSYSYEQDADLYQLSASDHEKLRLYQEKLIADKIRRKSGEVSISNPVENDNVRAEVTVEKDRIVIEIATPKGVDTNIHTDGTALPEGNIRQIEIYPETTDSKVDVTKEVNRDLS